MQKKIIIAILMLIVLAAGGFLVTKAFIGATETTADATRFEPGITFAPDPDGFGFRNYSKRYPEGNLTIEEARDMFGDVVCTRLENDKCIPHPKVLTWLNEMNEMMNGTGHCIGFTVASHQLQTKFLSVNDLGAEKTFALNREVPVLRTISRGYSSFYAGNVWTQEVQGTPSEIVDALMLLDEPVDIGIYYPKYGQNGHSILGYNVVDKGNGIYHILVYDNNRPGEDNIIVVDTNKDTWFYAEGAVNPDQPAGNYQGDADTKSLSFIRLSVYNQPLACPADFGELCPSTAEKNFSVLTIFGRGKALAETSDGQIGQSGDTLVNTVPDSRFLPVRGELFSRQMPIMLLPDTDAFTLQAQGSQADEPLSMSVANPNLSVTVNDLIAQPEQIERLNFDPTTQQVAFVAGGPQRPSFEFIFTQNDVEYQVQTPSLKLDAGQDLTVNVDTANGDFIVTSNGQTIPKAVLLITRLTPDGEATFASGNLTISSGATQLLELAKWDGVGPMSLLVDDNNDGVYSKSTLTNEPVVEVLPAIGASEKIFKNLQHLVPYLDEEQSRAVANTLPTLDFTSEQLGSAYLALPDLQPGDLAGTLAGLNLPPKELAQFAVARRLDDAKTSTLLDDLGLPGNKRTAVEDAMKDQLTILDAQAEWDFLNPDDPAAALPAFIVDMGLPDDLANDFRALVAPPQEVAQLRSTPTSTETPAPTVTTVPPTSTPIPPTPTATSIPPTSTPIPPTPTATSIPPTSTPIPPTPTNTPASTPTSAPVVASDPLGGACSGDGVENGITFINATSVNVTTVWVDWDCGEQSYRTLTPGESYTQGTFTTHPWRVRSEATGEYLPLETPLGFVLTYINDTPGSNVTVTIRQ